VPIRTGRAMAVDTIVSLAADGTIAGLKDARGNPAETARVVAGAPDGFDVYSGDDGLTLPLLSVGAVGVVGVATHWSAGLHAEMIAAHGKGDLHAAAEVNARLGPSFAVEVGPTWVQTSAVKAALEILGVSAGPLRLPLPPLDDAVRTAVRGVLDELGARP
jgi:4-hydroxy-tetrahydrodipicolinate synthase